MPIQKMIEEVKDEVFVIDGTKFKFKPGKAFANDQIKKFEAKNDVELPAAYKEFVTCFGAAELFGIKFYAAKDLDFVYRYDKSKISGKTMPAEGVILFAKAPLFGDESYFAFTFKYDFKKAKADPEKFKVSVWAGDANSGEALDDIKPHSFEKWLAFWIDLMKSKSDS